MDDFYVYRDSLVSAMPQTIKEAFRDSTSLVVHATISLCAQERLGREDTLARLAEELLEENRRSREAIRGLVASSPVTVADRATLRAIKDRLGEV